MIHHSSPDTLSIVYFINRPLVGNKFPIFKICNQLQVFFFRQNLLRDFFPCEFIKMKIIQKKNCTADILLAGVNHVPASPFSVFLLPNLNLNIFDIINVEMVTPNFRGVQHLWQFKTIGGGSYYPRTCISLFFSTVSHRPFSQDLKPNWFLQLWSCFIKWFEKKTKHKASTTLHS